MGVDGPLFIYLFIFKVLVLQGHTGHVKKGKIILELIVIVSFYPLYYNFTKLPSPLPMANDLYGPSVHRL